MNMRNKVKSAAPHRVFEHDILATDRRWASIVFDGLTCLYAVKHVLCNDIVNGTQSIYMVTFAFAPHVLQLDSRLIHWDYQNEAYEQS